MLAEYHTLTYRRRYSITDTRARMHVYAHIHHKSDIHQKSVHASTHLSTY